MNSALMKKRPTANNTVLWRILYFLNKLLIFFNQIFLKGYMGDKFVTFNQKLKSMGSLVTEQNFKGSLIRWELSWKGGVLAYLQIWECPPG